MKKDKKLNLLYVDAGAHSLSRSATVLHEKVKMDMLKGVKENNKCVQRNTSHKKLPDLSEANWLT